MATKPESKFVSKVVKALKGKEDVQMRAQEQAVDFQMNLDIQLKKIDLELMKAVNAVDKAQAALDLAKINIIDLSFEVWLERIDSAEYSLNENMAEVKELQAEKAARIELLKEISA